MKAGDRELVLGDHPTLKRASQLPRLVGMLAEHPLVGEILIRSAVTPLAFGGDKVRLLEPEQNSMSTRMELACLRGAPSTACPRQ
jgi:hypothetical protein